MILEQKNVFFCGHNIVYKETLFVGFPPFLAEFLMVIKAAGGCLGTGNGRLGIAGKSSRNLDRQPNRPAFPSTLFEFRHTLNDRCRYLRRKLFHDTGI